MLIYHHTSQTQNAATMFTEATRRGVYIRDIRPLVVLSAICGFIPVTLNKSHFQVSFHPFRSTLLWYLCVTCAVMSGAYRAMGIFFSIIHNVGSSHNDWFLSVTGIIVMSCVMASPLAGIEFYMNITKCASDFLKLEKRLQWQSSLFVKRLSWCLAVVSVMLPFQLYAFTFLSSPWKASIELFTIPAYLVSTVLFSVIPLTVVTWFTSIRLTTEHLARQFKQELRAGALTPARVRFHRKTWLLLRSLVQRGAMIPCSMLSFILFVVAVEILVSYQAVMAVYKGAILLGCYMFSGSMFTCGVIFVLLHNAQLASEAVTKCYLPPLQLRAYVTVCDQSTRHEIDLLQTLVTLKDVKISLAGFCDARREIVGSVLTTTATYLIVLFQLHS